MLAEYLLRSFIEQMRETDADKQQVELGNRVVEFGIGLREPEGSKT